MNNENIDAIVDEILHDIIQQVDFDCSRKVLSQIDDMNQSYEYEPSPTNTEPDSMELIRALRGHSIRLPDSLEQSHQIVEKSSSTTTSSRITSSDRYVSYAIHQMGDSSQERLPALPLAADLPIYKTVQKKFPLNKTPSRDDDLTEFDATDNLTSYSDDLILQKCRTSKNNNQEQHFDASSTDEDVDDEIQTNLEQQPYQHYELATTPLSNDGSSSKERQQQQQQDDIYFIPGYAGLWRQSSESKSEQLSKADDEMNLNTKTRVN